MSEKLQQLLEKGEIESLLKLTKNSTDPLARFYYIAGLRKIGEFNIALSYIVENQMELYNYDAPQIISWHIDILFELNELDQALNVLKQYDNFPYFSLETNETIASLSEQIQKRRKDLQHMRHYNLPELERRLLSTNLSLVESALKYLGDYYHESYEGLLQKALLDTPLDITKSLILFFLTTRSTNSFNVRKFDKIINVSIPNLKAFLPVKQLKKMEKQIEDLVTQEKEIRFGETIRTIFNSHLMFYYPLLIEDKDVEKYIQYLHFVALKTIIPATDAIYMSDVHGYNEDDLNFIETKYKFEIFFATSL